MFHGSLRPHYVMGALIAALLAITGAAGLLNPSMYLPFIASSLVAGMPVQDLMSLLAAPLLIAAMVYAGRGHVCLSPRRRRGRSGLLYEKHPPFTH